MKSILNVGLRISAINNLRNPFKILRKLSSRDFCTNNYIKDNCGNRILFQDETVKVVVVKDKSLIKEIADICAKSFVGQEPVITISGMTTDCVVKQAELCANIGIDEETVCAVLSKDTGKVLSVRIVMSCKGKKNYMDFIEKSVEFKGNIEVHDDILSRVEDTSIDLSKSIYVFMMATCNTAASKGFGKLLVHHSLNYYRTLKYEYLYSEASSLKALKTVKADNMSILKQFAYKDYEYKGKKLVPNHTDVLTSYVIKLNSKI